MRVRVSGDSGESPRQAHLDALFASSTGGRVLAGGVAGGRALGERVLCEIEASELEAVRDALRVREGSEPFRCMCRGDMAVELHGARGLTGAVGIHHGVSVRLEEWNSDAALEDGERFLRWLAAQGVEEPLVAYRRAVVAAREGDRAHAEWVASAPPPLVAHLRELERDGIPAFNEVDYAAAKQALSEAYASPSERARALLEWYGSGAGPWSGAPAYEGVAGRLLSFMSEGDVLASMAAGPTTPALLDGGGRYCAGRGWTRTDKKILDALAGELRQRLVARAEERGIEDNVGRLLAAFAPPQEVRAPGGARLVGTGEHDIFYGIAPDDGRVFAIDKNEVVAFDLAAGDRSRAVLFSLAEGTRAPALALGGDFIVFRNGANIIRMKKGGGAVELVARPSWPSKNWCVHRDHLYWIDDCSRDEAGRMHAVSRAPLAGGPAEQVVEPRPGAAWSLLVDDAGIFWTREERVRRFLRGEKKRVVIEHFPHGGARSIEIASAPDAPWTLAVDTPMASVAARLWWSNYSTSELLFAEKSAGKRGTAVTAVPVPGKPLRIAASAQGAYAMLEAGAEYVVVHVDERRNVEELTRFPSCSRGLHFASGPGYVCFAVETMLAVTAQPVGKT